jgi:hypothetical protein
MAAYRLLLPCSLAFAPCAAACGAEPLDPEVPPIVWSGAHLDYAPLEHAEPVCAGTLPYMDRYVGLAAAAMRVDLDEPLVYVHGSRDDAALCEALGCTFIDGRIYSLVAPYEHELVHGVRSFADWSHAFFEEGAAEMFGGDSSFPSRIPADGELLEGIETASAGNRLPDAWYARAGRFSAYLHDRHGPNVTEAILRDTDWDASAEAVVDVIEAETEMRFEEVLADYAAEPVCHEAAQYRYPLFPCDAPEALRARCDGAVAVRIEEQVSCDDPSTLGPRDGEIWQYVAFDVPVAGEYTLEHASELAPAGWIEVRECAMGCGAITVANLITRTYADPEAASNPSVFLRAGRYALRLSRPAAAPSAVSVWIRGEDCR